RDRHCGPCRRGDEQACGPHVRRGGVARPCGLARVQLLRRPRGDPASGSHRGPPVADRRGAQAPAGEEGEERLTANACSVILTTCLATANSPKDTCRNDPGGI